MHTKSYPEAKKDWMSNFEDLREWGKRQWEKKVIDPGSSVRFLVHGYT